MLSLNRSRKASVARITDWPEHGKTYRLRVTRMASDLRGIIDASVSKIRIDHFGRFPSLDLRESFPSDHKGDIQAEQPQGGISPASHGS